MQYYPEGQGRYLSASDLTAGELGAAAAEGRVLEAVVTMCDSAHNLHVDLGAVHGVIPREEGAVGIAQGTVRDIALISRVNRPVCFVISRFETLPSGETAAVLSRRAVQQACMENYINKLTPGDVIDAAVTHLERFGAFIDIGAGINALIPIDMLSVSRIQHPGERVRPGQAIRAVLRKREDGRLTFSMRELLGTWLQNAARFQAGETVPGIVRSVEEYGVFVELAPNLAGLAEPCTGLAAAQQVSVFIKSILPEKMKIKLVVVDAFGAAGAPAPLHFLEDAHHLSRWVYSPPGCGKHIETVF